MAYKCDYCGKGKVSGHMVSHAKNRLARLFLPNLQKLKVLKNGVSVRVKFCASCIKRMRKDGGMGQYSLIKWVSPANVAAASSLGKAMKAVQKETKAKEVKEKVTKAKETLDIASIVGKKG